MKALKIAAAGGILLIALAVGGCASKANFTGDIADESAPVDEAVASDSVGDKVAKSQEPGFTAGTVSDDARNSGLLSRRLIYFDYDKSLVRTEFLSIAEAHAEFLAVNRDKGIILEGHADERGSNEYNLALGQRRADSVRDIMLANGVFDEQIETVSFGEERPRAFGQDEAAWRENRRVEIIYRDE